MKPYAPEAYDLLHQGTLALAEVEREGILIDVPYLKDQRKQLVREIKEARARLAESDVAKAWRDTFRGKTNWDSRPQLGKVLFDVMRLRPKPERTAGGLYSTKEEDLARLQNPFVRDYLEITKLQKADQFLEGIERELHGNKVHPFFSLNINITYRSNSDTPNFQNMPVRNKKMKAKVRRCVIAPKDYCLVEIDYKGVEVGIAYCYHEDPRMGTYLHDKSKDMHRDAAMDCYMLSLEEVTDEIRYCGKNKFVFPQFYGSWWMDCSASLWHAIEVMNLKTASGVPLRKHLKREGITGLGYQNRDDPSPEPGSFEEHIQKVERHFWRKRFPVYAEWKKQWYEEYQKKGWFLTKTGFICQGLMKRNEVINYPVQGSAFHCLLWSLVQLVLHQLIRSKLDARLICQIHDSLIFKVHKREVDDLLRLCQRVMVELLMEHWSWIICPMEISAEVTPPGGSWVDKEKRKIPT